MRTERDRGSGPSRRMAITSAYSASVTTYLGHIHRPCPCRKFSNDRAIVRVVATREGDRLVARRRGAVIQVNLEFVDLRPDQSVPYEVIINPHGGEAAPRSGQFLGALNVAHDLSFTCDHHHGEVAGISVLDAERPTAARCDLLRRSNKIRVLGFRWFSTRPRARDRSLAQVLAGSL